MSFSWKNKTRRKRFSQLIADHIQSPKRGSSLVVETGFPTSIIDLYVRNRGRFRKLSAKKPNQSSSADSDSRSNYDEIIEEVVVDGDDDEIKIVNYRKTKAKLNHVIVVMLMAVLICGSTRFNIGITLFACVLLLLESVWNRLNSVNLDSKPLFESSVRLKQTAAVVYSEVLEIEQRVESQQEESDKVLIEIGRKSSSKAMMKSRIEKLVPKKLCRSSMDSKLEICYEFKEEAAVRQVVCLNECLDSKGETFCLLKQDLDKTECKDEELGSDLQQNYGCSVLFLIVLVGLIGGQFLALGMVLSWCLILKLLSRNVKCFIF